MDSDWIIGCGQDCRKWSSTKLADGSKWFVPFAHINVLITLDKRGNSWCFSSMGRILRRTRSHKTQALETSWTCRHRPRVFTRGPVIDPPPSFCESVRRWFLLFTKNQWTPCRTRALSQRGMYWAGNASIHLFVFSQNVFGWYRARSWQIHNWVTLTVKTQGN